MKSPTGMLGALALVCALGGCGTDRPAGATITDTAAVAPVASDCPGATLEALERVGHSVYEESASGRIVGQAVHRLEDSRALGEAVADGRTRAARRVLRGLLLNQIVSVRVQRDGLTLAQIRRGSGIAPARGRVLLNGQAVGTFAVSVQGAGGYVQTTSGLTGAQVLVRSGGRTLASTLHVAARALDGRRTVDLAGVRYRVDAFTATAFPDRPLRIALLVPVSAVDAICGGERAPGPARARADVWGQVAERIYDAEHAGSKAQLIRGVVERSSAFRAAVLAGNAQATRAAIIGFFRSHLHVVRVRVTRAGRLLVDVGGPHVLAPIAGVIRDARGHVAAHFLLAIQDDLGFTLLAQAFTGAQALLRVGAEQVAGTLSPGPARIPERGRVRYGASTYEAYSFEGRAFPAGTLRISLLYPAS
jgi:hypothetical protein